MVIRREKDFYLCVSQSPTRSGFASSARESPLTERSAIMKKTLRGKTKAKQPKVLAPEYHFYDGKAKENRFAKRTRPESMAILLDPDVAQVFETGKAVNAVLRALMTMPAGRGSSHR